MKFFKTNVGLSYGDWAYLVSVGENKNLIIASPEEPEVWPMYIVGKIDTSHIDELEPVFVSKELAYDVSELSTEVLDLILAGYTNEYEQPQVLSAEIYVEVEAGAHILPTYEEASALAKRTNRTVVFKFNGVEVKVGSFTSKLSVEAQLRKGYAKMRGEKDV